MVSLQKHNSKKFLNYLIHVLKENNLTMKVLVPPVLLQALETAYLKRHDNQFLLKISQLLIDIHNNDQ